MVSIIIPCFNGEKFIERSINSILNQTYRNLQLIIVNDGSIDETEDIIKSKENEIKKQNINYTYIYQDNKGVGSAIKKGLEYVKGEFLTLLDADDYIMEDSIELKVKFLKCNSDYDIVRTNGYYVSEDNLNETRYPFVTNEDEKKATNIFEGLIMGKYNNWSGSYMVRAKLILDFYRDRDFYESRYGQNLQIMLPIAYKSKCGFIDIPLMKYIKQTKSLSQVENEINIEIDNIIKFQEIKESVLKLIVEDEEIEYILHRLKCSDLRYFMYLACNYKDKNVMRESYHLLKKINANTIEDDITYYNLNNRILGILFRIKRKFYFRR